MNISQPGGSESDGALLSPQKQTVGAAAFPSTPSHWRREEQQPEKADRELFRPGSALLSLEMVW